MWGVTLEGLLPYFFLLDDFELEGGSSDLAGLASDSSQTLVQQSLSEDPSLTTCFFPGRDGVGGWG